MQVLSFWRIKIWRSQCLLPRARTRIVFDCRTVPNCLLRPRPYDLRCTLEIINQRWYAGSFHHSTVFWSARCCNNWGARSVRQAITFITSRCYKTDFTSMSTNESRTKQCVPIGQWNFAVDATLILGVPRRFRLFSQHGHYLFPARHEIPRSSRCISISWWQRSKKDSWLNCCSTQGTSPTSTT